MWETISKNKKCILRRARFLARTLLHHQDSLFWVLPAGIMARIVDESMSVLPFVLEKNEVRKEDEVLERRCKCLRRIILSSLFQIARSEKRNGLVTLPEMNQLKRKWYSAERRLICNHNHNITKEEDTNNIVGLKKRKTSTLTMPSSFSSSEIGNKRARK